VLQSGEDLFFTDDIFCDIIENIRKKYADCAITLSVGEKSRQTYEKYRNAGADRFLLRHETANCGHYGKLHPQNMCLENRKNCLFTLKELGFQTGSGFMVGSPFQTVKNLIDDLRFLQELKPEMIGIGPFIPHKDTPFADKNSGTAELTLRLIAVLRLLFPKALIPATTALGTIAPDGRERGLCAGANVVMPNLSPLKVRKKYSLYDNKICTGEEAAECRFCLENRIKSAGYEMVVDRGDAL
jgi:biotin synthase